MLQLLGFASAIKMISALALMALISQKLKAYYTEVLPESSSIISVMESKADDSKGASSSIAPLSRDYFTFHNVLGDGQFGIVYLATDKIRKESVAIKEVLKRKLVKNEIVTEEGEVLQISHKCPHLIHGLGAFQTEDQVYYVMELASGKSLCDLQNRRCLVPSEIQFIAAELTCGVQFLHKNAILHRDLKLENVLVGKNGHIKITDFGLCVTGYTKDIEMWPGGTPGYMAPEVVNFEPHGPGVDYFAIGVIVYELCTNYPPFPGKDFHEYKKSLQCEPSYPEYLDHNVILFIRSLLCRNPHERLGVYGDIRAHDYFIDIDWEEMEAGRAKLPEILNKFYENSLVSTPDLEEISDKEQDGFRQISFVCPEWSQQYHSVIIRKEKSRDFPAT